MMAEKPAEKLMTVVRKMDMYSKVDAEFKVTTTTGGYLSIVGWALTCILILSETWAYWREAGAKKEHMIVDSSLGQKLRINLNITFPALSCAEMHVDAMDVAGDYHPYMEQNMKKKRIGKDGRPVGREIEEQANVFENKDDILPDDYCGSCYGAAEYDGDCCNTCDQVISHYSAKGWSTKEIRRDSEQCVREQKSPLAGIEEGEGCNLSGFMLVNKVAGNFHVALGESVVRDGRFIHQFQPQDAPGFNTTHYIHSLSFGMPYPGMNNPLDQVVKVVDEEQGTGLYQYFIKLVPTIYEAPDGARTNTNQYSYTERFRPLASSLAHTDHDHNKHGSHATHQATTVLPGVFWVYDMSAFMVEISHAKVPFSHFLARLCAIAGGVFTVMGLIDALCHHFKVKLDLPPQLTALIGGMGGGAGGGLGAAANKGGL